MNTPELYAILKNCFSPEEIQQLVPTGDSANPYENAIESIISENETGVALIAELDRLSKNHRAKIQAMKANDLRNGIAFEFMETGLTYGLVLWALYRDDRIVARDLAYKLAIQYTQELVSNSLDEDLEEEAIEVDLAGLIDVMDEDLEDEEDLDLYTDEELDEMLYSVDEDEDSLLSEFSTGKETSDISDEEVNQIIETFTNVDEHSHDKPSQSAPNYDELIQKMLRNECEEDLEESTDSVDELIAGLSHNESHNQVQAAQTDDVQSAGEHIQIGGVEIALQSLKTACERVFQEPIELVTDKNLTEQDKIVVIGQHCGVRVLNGPRYQATPHLGLPPHDHEPVVISSESIQLALSRIYHEPVELIPDQALLDQGLVVFTGKNTGLEICHQPRARVSLPTWVDPKQVHASITDSQQGTSTQEVDALKEQLLQLTERIKTLESQGLSNHPGSPEPVIDLGAPTEEKPEIEEPVPEPKTAPVDMPETDTTEDVTPATKTEIEQEQLSSDEQADEALDLMASISGKEQSGQSSEEPAPERSSHESTVNEESVELDEFDDLNLDDLDDLDDLDLGDLGNLDDLDDLDDDQSDTNEPNDPQLSANKKQDAPSSGKTESFDELDLDDDLDLGDLKDLDLDLELDDSDLTTDFKLEAEGIDDLEDLDLDLSDINQWNQEVDDKQKDEVDKKTEGEPKPPADSASVGDDFNLDLDINELDLEEEQKQVYSGERILLLGGEAKHHTEYERVVNDLGAIGEFYPQLSDYEEDEIIELVDGADLIITLSDEAVSDPGILTASNYAQANHKRVFQHHSAIPGSVKKKLIQLVEEGKV